MADVPSISRMPGSDSVLAQDEFDAGEIAGMRTAGWIFVALAVVNAIAAASGASNLWVGAGVSALLGYKLLRLRHSWRGWAMLGAAVSGVLGLLIAVTGLVASNLLGVLIGLGQVLVSSSLLMLMWGRPTMRRVFRGRLIFAGGVAMTVAAMIAGMAQGFPE